MLLGAGELARELVIAFQRLGAVVIAVDAEPDAPAQRAADRALTAAPTDSAEIAGLIERERPAVVVVGDGWPGPHGREDVEVLPSAKAAALTADREGLRRLAADELGLPTAPFWFASSAAELAAVAAHAGYPLVVSPLGPPAGEGQSVLLRAEDVEPAWTRATATGAGRVMAESVVEVDYQVTLLTVRGVKPGGHGVQFCEPIGHRLVGDAVETWQPQAMSPAALDVAKSVAARIVNALGGRGLFGVELLVRGDEVYFADVSAHPFASGLVTVRSQRLSAFELHARAVLGLPVDTILVSPGAAELVSAPRDAAPATADPIPVLADALHTAESDVLLFGPPHRHAAAIATAPDVIRARDRVRQLAAALRKLW
ncbi:formate-dependent phosphoribosylglycinamide formyltransferase [Mycobacterium sp. MYCO198283]|nr:formate-dependent phosphoribosylglycinamide formyltransferase [Mycobacterium sp. MYCO198283]